MYVGSTNGKNPKYIGSGILFNAALKKYGLENFEKEILYEGPNFQTEEERILKKLDAAGSAQYYNLKNEAIGGSFFGPNNGMWKRRLPADVRYKQGSAFRGQKRPDHSIKMSGENNPMFGQNAHAYGLQKRNKEVLLGKTYEEIYGKDKADHLRNKLSNSQRGKKHELKMVQCNVCGIVGGGPNMTRYHFELCNSVVCIGCHQVVSISVLKQSHSKCAKRKHKG